MQHTETVEIRGHLIDSGTFARILDDVLEYSGDYRIDQLDVGRTHTDESYVKLTIGSDDHEQLERIIMRLQTHGANMIDPGRATLRPAPRDGVFPEDFYSTTNLETRIRLDAGWMRVANPEMDCGIVVDDEGARTIPVADIREGEMVVCGANGIKVTPLRAPVRTDPNEATFEFMSSDVSSEKPQALLVRQVAQRMRDVKAAGKKILWVGGPAIVHTGAAPALVALVEDGYVDVLFAGNALATHDIESALFGTSLGVDLDKGHGVPHGHEHHIRAINRIRACGSIAEAVSQGVLRSGVMHSLVRHDKEFVLVGSVRDDGPLPDVYTDVIEGQRAMRNALKDVGFAIMVATMLHSIATGNMLPASIPLVSVDINPATVTKLADRGSAQATGVITDIGLFCEQLAAELVVGYKRD
ncbi:lysine-ketoglutarate reductase/saccharopine dehydrogenase-like protein (TIGR00300 family) [Stackebrandtia albiflava]|uniref:ornithine cyclodeaminase n=1 Tax=Stackebrandtia albiflava TaxID=406432 RepID=A0A562VGT5_9ACTN|nr:TIGR00300 family protein [Stackebrandtia albiflava]TWJ17115.1 lysine-ketoglutarate reductase/saccharopine dehydrogenase-like protein (TIGR00300 family) [Stackebrandtia albiflava]